MKRIPASFKAKAIQLPKRSPRRWLLVGVQGETGTGKSEFVLSAPDPLFVLNYDNGLRLLIDKHLESGWDKVVGVHTVSLSPAINQARDMEKLKEAQDKFLAAAQDPDVRSLAIDQGAQLWEHVRRAVHGKLTQVPPIMYAASNATFKWFVDTADHFHKNLIITWPMTDEYVLTKRYNKQRRGYEEVEAKSGRRVRRGKGDAEEMVELHIQLTKDVNVREVPDKFSLTILKCRHNTTLEGEELPGMIFPDCLTFTGLMQYVFPQSKPGEWE